MKIRLNTLYAGPAGVIQPGQEVEMPDEIAAPLVADGYAVNLSEVVAPKQTKKKTVE